MKKNILIASVAIATGVAFLVARKSKKKSTNFTAQRSAPPHHMTDVFARAKQEAVK